MKPGDKVNIKSNPPKTGTILRYVAQGIFDSYIVKIENGQEIIVGKGFIEKV